ncbi:hypothetical protein F7734_35715 [Scytonema sp. UIC 10036]|uniref:hypothetical protein n=1 Tax=Scytonema sp. UIC 10036 TaxID=2304196 RepID=UPI0012DA447E|nr:hypothetical protein [Scytonema sp. UIC 10036]MUG97389.1 hypothetical protein [Scytonema sp. UIC 10036]
MEKNQQEYLTTNLLPSTHEELLVSQEEIELLRELIESQNGYIYQLEQKLLEVKQELDITNQELSKALLLGVCLDEAKALAKIILQEQKIGTKLVAQLLTVIYGSLVKPEELKEIDLLISIPERVKNDSYASLGQRMTA